MASQEIAWIAVPNGLRLVDGVVHARVSVLVSPRLQPDGDTLAGAFLNWPQRLRAGDVTFEVRIGDVSRTATVVDQMVPNTWAALFDATTFVRAYNPDANSGIVGSYATARVHDMCKTAYQETFASSPLDPPADVVPPAFEGLRELFVPATVAAEVAGSDDDARARLGREIFRPADDATLQARLDQLVDLAAAETEQELVRGVAPSSREIIPDTGDPALELARLALFHRKPGGSRIGTREASPDDARIDFHQQLANLGEYPALQRSLGLIIDLDVDVTGVSHTTADAHGLLSVVPHFGDALVPATTPVTPNTAFVLSDAAFEAAVSGVEPRDIRAGLLDLALTIGEGGDPAFRIIQVDVDSAGFGAIDLLTQAADGAADPASGLASLRSSGVSIARYGNGRFLMDDIAIGLGKMAAIANGETDVTLFAEDLIRGYRIDVRKPPSGSWRSLHQRSGVYRFTTTGQQRLLLDEGFLQPSLVQPPRTDPPSTTHDASAPNYVAESLFLWQGWSLAARRPGLVMEQPPATDPSPVAPVSGVKLDTTFSATPGTLPRLRFGQRYEFRVRLADLVGGGLTSDEADAVLATLDASTPRPLLPAADESFRYLRFDVVPSPVVLPRIAPGRGASTERVVLRSNHDVTADDYAQQHPEVPEYALSGERHVVPPKTWQLLAEASGLFDASIGTGADIERTHELMLRAETSLGDDEVHAEPVVTVPYLADPLAVGAVLRDVPGVADGALGSVDDDVLRLDGALRADPQPAPQSVVTVGFGQQWPDRQGFRIRLREGSLAPQWDAAERMLSVFLPKGETRTINASSLLADESALELMGMWAWLIERLDELVRQGSMTPEEQAALVAQLRQLSIVGQCWMLTPPRQLTLVHAVQQPVDPPSLTRLEAVRLPGKTYAIIDAVVGVHGDSTGQLELRWKAAGSATPAPEAPALPSPFVLPAAGESTPPLSGDAKAIASFDAASDTVTFHAPNPEALEARVGRDVTGLEEQFAQLVAAANALHPFDRPARDLVRDSRSDMLDRLFVLDVLSITEHWSRLVELGRVIRDWVDSWVGDPPDPGFPAMLPDALHGDAQQVGVAADVLKETATAALAELDQYPARHEFGDTKYRKVTYRAVATTRFGDCFPESVGTALDLTRTSVDVDVDVLNTATPPPPRIAYIVPRFDWHRQGSAESGSNEGFDSQRDAGGLRVYLEGPWFASGEGELLGVAVATIPGASVVAPGGAEWNGPITNWARDPLWDTDSSPTLPTSADFQAFEMVAAKVCLPDGDRFIVTMVGFAVQHDDATGRYYSDITLDRQDPIVGYFPFVRLALTRFQPMSIRGVESSPVVLADFAQLTPWRGVSVVRRDSGVVDVTVSGLTHRSANFAVPGGTGTRVRVAVQERIPGALDDAGWIVNSDAVVTEGSGELWTGTLQIPDRPAGTLRLLIEELEAHAMFQQELGDPEFIERVVFAETVPL